MEVRQREIVDEIIKNTEGRLSVNVIFRRIWMIPELEEILKVKIPTPYTSEGKSFLFSVV